MTRDFAGEKGETLVFFTAGACAVAAAALLLLRVGGWRHLAWPLAVLAVPEIVVAVGIYLRTDGRVAALREKLAAAPRALLAEEISRMDQVMARFRTYQAVELAVLTAGVVLVLLGKRRSSLQAAGLGLFAQAALLFILDQFAERRRRGPEEGP
jgi:hypothetical protein